MSWRRLELDRCAIEKIQAYFFEQNKLWFGITIVTVSYATSCELPRVRIVLGFVRCFELFNLEHWVC
jgi:hypothetical protein